ncbi:hypothetical protein [Bradyrhizobium sp. 1]|uniref:hypothetical protein n=1 Tax=Bradyrhizobium sp. 1 TaxID=241591 RepID=UPI001FFB3B02|nr:hypothetical protein [Bradyrhizobium sp. 1]MCK1389490.1 hypothetical protein [Bradyrhizobium sp. 1]
MRAFAAAALANSFVRLLSTGVLKQFALFCAAVLFVWLLSLTYGLDLSVGFF